MPKVSTVGAGGLSRFGVPGRPAGADVSPGPPCLGTLGEAWASAHPPRGRAWALTQESCQVGMGGSGPKVTGCLTARHLPG